MPGRPQAIAVMLLVLAVFAALGYRATAPWYPAMAEAWRARPMRGSMALAMAAYAVAMFARTSRCRLVAGPDIVLPWATSANVVAAGHAFNHVSALRLGEIVRSLVLARQTGVGWMRALLTTVVERALDVLVVGGLAFAMEGLDAPHAARMMAAAVVGILVLLLIGTLPGLVVPLASRFGSLFSARKHDAILKGALEATTYGKSFLSVTRWLRALVHTFVIWLFECIAFTSLLGAASLPEEPVLGARVMVHAYLGTVWFVRDAFLSRLGQEGIDALVQLGARPLDARSYMALSFLVISMPITVWGMGALAWYAGLATRRRILALASRFGEQSGQDQIVFARMARGAVVLRVVPFDCALVRALLPAAASDDDVTRAAGFVSEQMRALPLSMRLAFAGGTILFRALCWLRHGRDFCSLPDEPQRRFAAAWAFGGLSLPRMLLRPVRSLALFAYYEKPSEPLRAHARARVLPLVSS